MAFFLVTGGAGFIGSHIVQELLRGKHRIRVIDNFSTGKRENLADFLDRIDLVRGDIRDSEAVKEAVKGVDYVLHQAALASVARSVDDPLEANGVNVQGTLNLLEASRKEGIRRFVLASSSSVYGSGQHLPKREIMKPNPISPYAITKLAGEKYCQVFYGIYGLETVCLRYFNVFGPRQNPESQYAAVIPKFISALLHDRSPTVYGDGEQTRDFTYVSNVVTANIQACAAGEVVGQVLNVACGTRYSLNDLFFNLQRIFGVDLSARYVEPRLGDVRHSLADISKARKLMDYRPKVTFEEGLEKTVDWFKKQHASRSRGTQSHLRRDRKNPQLD
jgi:nucleoside-diphosphate-sugar epimerase